ncbi:pre-B-cell leukemia homeobox interacting protein 1b isoform X2 [Kryptolebias marmoratus]|uniref:pre-B-cell leukemia homeobox interacting protein 1b isoform X2 n=1 Tax=Kryptolebias marmoratus TaxID=37003 RepID=UPI0007F90A71|nr:pre-B-cell leukemia homeobox interacting protein 1b isoform X2 [Kryptolebias marmoratus]
MSGGSGTNNSWTILSSEESVAETLRPFTAGAEQHEGSPASPTGPSESDQPAKSADSAEGLPVGDHPVPERNPAELGSAPPPPEVSATSEHDDNASPTAGRAEGPPRPGSDPEPSPGSCPLLTPSPDGPPPGQAEFAPTEEQLTEEESRPLRSERDLRQNGEEPEQGARTADSGKRAEVDEDRPEETAERGEPEARRKEPLLAALEQIGRREEEDEEEEFQVPQQGNGSVFSLNKCILGAVILLAFGTIFFSGVFVDLNEESDHAVGELRDAEAAGKQDWLGPEAPPHADAGSSELLNKLAEGSQQISALRAQLQAQKEELKVAKERAAEGAQERLLWEEVEKENSRLKTEMTSLPVLQKENDRMKRELQSVAALQKELESLRSTVTKLKRSSGAEEQAGETARADVSHSTPPPPGQPEDGSQVTAGSTDRQTRKLWDNQKEKKDLKRDKYETGERKQPKERGKSARKEGEERELNNGGKKEWKKEKHEAGIFGKERDKAGKHKRQGDEGKDWKREKSGRGDDGKLWKEERERKKGKHENVNGGKERGKEEKRDWQKGSEGWKGEKDWKKGKDGKEKWERKTRKEAGETGEWKKDGERRDKNSKEGKAKNERKQWEDGKNRGRDGAGRDERKSQTEEEWRRRDEELDQWKRGAQREKKRQKEWKKEQSKSLKTKTEHRPAESPEHDDDEHLYGEQNPAHSHRRPSVGQPGFWLQQRERLRRDPRPPRRCDSPESCAQAERLLPVTLPEFQAVLQPYLSKAEGAGVGTAHTQELRGLAAEFFEDGVFVHEQMSFRDFAEDLGDVLEDLVEGEDGDEDEDGDGEDSAIEDEMEEFAKEVLKRFSVPDVGERERRMMGERRKESGQERG